MPRAILLPDGHCQHCGRPHWRSSGSVSCCGSTLVLRRELVAAIDSPELAADWPHLPRFWLAPAWLGAVGVWLTWIGICVRRWLA